MEVNSSSNPISGSRPVPENLKTSRSSKGSVRRRSSGLKKEDSKVDELFSKSVSESPKRIRKPDSPVSGQVVISEKLPKLSHDADVKLLQEYEQNLEGALSSVGKGEVLEDRFFYNDTLLAEEKAVRVDTVSILASGNRDRIQDLQRSIREAESGELKIDPEELKKSEYKLAVSEKRQGAIEVAAAYGKTWASSASYRKLLQKTRSIEKADDEYVPACVNLRTQQLRNGEGKLLSSLNRSGAVSDYRNGATNAREMKQLAATLETLQNIEDLSYPDREALHRILPESALGGTRENKSLEEIKVLLGNAIVDRELVLENQALTDLTAHFEGLISSGVDLSEYLQSTSKVFLGRVSLLDGIKPADTSGEGGLFVLSEKNQILDMKEIYDVLNGKDIAFDGKGPFIDTAGKIHLPFNIQKEGEPVSKKLEAVFFNISTQGNILNEGVQQQINRDALLQLRANVEGMQAIPEEKREQIFEQIDRLEMLLDSKVKDGFDLAEVTMDLLSLCDFLVSINCFSGKDRTGEAALVRTWGKLNEIVDSLDLPTKKKEGLKAKFGRDLLREDGIAYSVVRDNTGHSALKVMVPDLKPLRGSGTINRSLGKMRRIKMYIDAAVTFVPEKFLSQVKDLKPGSDQLHTDS